MAHESDPRFLVLHALRVKGFAGTPILTEMTGLDEATVTGVLATLHEQGFAAERTGRIAGWLLTPPGKEEHHRALQAELEAAGGASALSAAYPPFLELNERFKQLCGDWQLRDGQPNDHSDAAYDRAVIARLDEIDDAVQPVCQGFAAALSRFAPYGPRLSSTRALVDGGEHTKFTGVMNGSYHDVWMELHQDLILTLAIDREQEGSF